MCGLACALTDHKPKTPQPPKACVLNDSRLPDLKYPHILDSLNPGKIPGICPLLESVESRTRYLPSFSESFRPLSATSDVVWTTFGKFWLCFGAGLALFALTFVFLGHLRLFLGPFCPPFRGSSVVLSLRTRLLDPFWPSFRPPISWGSSSLSCSEHVCSDKKKKRFKRIQQIEPKVKLDDYSEPTTIAIRPVDPYFHCDRSIDPYLYGDSLSHQLTS